MQTLIAVDLNAPYHEWVVERAIPLSTVAGGRVDVGYVGEDDPRARSRLTTLLRLIPENIRGEVRIEEGPIADRLLAWSKDLDLLILGPREPTAIERVLRGSVVLKVLRATECPVIIPRKPFHEDASWRILVGVDLQGKYKNEVVGMASEWASRFGGRLDAVYAIHDPLPAIGDPELRARAHREWVAALPHVLGLTVGEQSWWLVHAGLPRLPVDTSAWAMEDWIARAGAELLWCPDRPSGRPPGDRPYVMGHRRVKEPLDAGHLVALDTGSGTVPEGRLSALLLPEREMITVG